MIVALIVIGFVFVLDILPLIKKGPKRDLIVCASVFTVASVVIIMLSIGVKMPRLMDPFVHLYELGAAAGLPGFN